MKVNERTISVLAWRRQARDMQRAGYERCEPCWRLLRGGSYNNKIVSVVISVCGKYVYFKTDEQRKST